MSVREIHAGRLIGRTVSTADGRRIGRLQEIVVERDGTVVEYRVGAYGLLERLAASAVARAIIRTLGMGLVPRGYRVPWQALDLSDPERPRLVCGVESLKSMREGSAP